MTTPAADPRKAEIEMLRAQNAKLLAFARAHKEYDLACQSPEWDWDKLTNQLHELRRLRDEAMQP